MKYRKKEKRIKVYNFRVSESELKMIREVAREIDLPYAFRSWIKELYDELYPDPDDTAYKI